MAMTAMLASCSKNAETTVPTPDDGSTPQVQITLKADDQQTRAFFDNTAAAEAWEKEVTALTIYVYDQSGNILVRRSMSASEVAAKSALFSLPNSAAGKNCTFYVVANANYGEVISTAAMDNQIESLTLDEYNGTFAQTAEGRKRSAGFVMTGKTTTAIASAGNTTTVPVTVKRVVAKIAVRAKLADDFTTLYNGGRVVITSANIKQANDFSYSFANAGGVYSGTYLYTHTQASNVSGTEYQNMFYVYERESGGLPANKYLITLTGYFDADGNMSTTYDQSDTEFSITLYGHGDGEIKRNGYYRIDATIKGLSGNGLLVNLTVADWETPVTQSLELGI